MAARQFMSALPDGQISKMPSSVVARTERSELRDFRRAGGVPDCAIGRRFAPTRWLHPGYGPDSIFPNSQVNLVCHRVVIASEAKQSSFSSAERKLDCFVASLLAMTVSAGALRTHSKQKRR